MKWEFKNQTLYFIESIPCEQATGKKSRWSHGLKPVFDSSRGQQLWSNGEKQDSFDGIEWRSEGDLNSPSYPNLYISVPKDANDFFAVGKPIVFKDVWRPDFFVKSPEIKVKSVKVAYSTDFYMQLNGVLSFEIEDIDALFVFKSKVENVYVINNKVHVTFAELPSKKEWETIGYHPLHDYPTEEVIKIDDTSYYLNFPFNTIEELEYNGFSEPVICCFNGKLSIDEAIISNPAKAGGIFPLLSFLKPGTKISFVPKSYGYLELKKQKFIECFDMNNSDFDGVKFIIKSADTKFSNLPCDIESSNYTLTSDIKNYVQVFSDKVKMCRNLRVYNIIYNGALKGQYWKKCDYDKAPTRKEWEKIRIARRDAMISKYGNALPNGWQKRPESDLEAWVDFNIKKDEKWISNDELNAILEKMLGDYPDFDAFVYWDQQAQKDKSLFVTNPFTKETLYSPTIVPESIEHPWFFDVIKKSGIVEFLCKFMNSPSLQGAVLSEGF